MLRCLTFGAAAELPVELCDVMERDKLRLGKLMEVALLRAYYELPSSLACPVGAS